MTNTWESPPRPAAADALASSLGLRHLTARLLCRRGQSTPDKAKRFLNSTPLLYDPLLLPGVAESVDLLLKASGVVWVYGDYDTDGVTGSAILWRALKDAGVKVRCYIPNRRSDGYGVHSASLKRLRAAGATVVVTVDCGIACPDESLYARRIGLTYIVTDHHEPREHLPDADAIVHPRINAGSYPWGGLCGAGVAFKLAHAIYARRNRSVPDDLLAIAALGTVADVVPLLDENRSIVRHGLTAFRASAMPGIDSLRRFCGLDERSSIQADDFGFQVAPRINACGRLACASVALELLTTANAARADEITSTLDRLNTLRKKMERRVYNDAKAKLDPSAPAIVLADKSWPAGVVGIVAGRLAEEFNRPVLLACTDGKNVVGSGRAPEGVLLNFVLQAASSSLTSHGGHKAAVGFKLDSSKLAAFESHFTAAVEKTDKPAYAGRRCDGDADFSELDLGALYEIDALAPFGMANPVPLLRFVGVRLAGPPRIIGSDRTHLQLQLCQSDGRIIPAVAFGMAFRVDELRGGAFYNFWGTPQINEWRGRRTVQLHVRDFAEDAI